MPERFHADPVVAASELLLQERVPRVATVQLDIGERARLNARLGAGGGPEARLTESALDQAKAVFPALRGAKVAQHWAGLIDVTPDEVQLMDLENYETFQLPIPEEYKGQLTAGEEIMYMIAMDRRKITKV